MTTAEHFRSLSAAGSSEVMIAGVAWPLYKVIALVVGFLVLAIVGVVTFAAAPAVLSGAAAGTAVWIVLGALSR